jgi:hypothetical protein
MDEPAEEYHRPDYHYPDPPPDTKPVSYGTLYFKAVKWYLGNALFGLVPVLLIWLVNGLTEGRTGAEKIYELIHDGVIVFVCIALMGAVMVEFLLSGPKMSGFSIFTVYFIPLIILGFISLDYLLIYLNIVDKSVFNLGSRTTVFTIILSFTYCTFTKATLEKKEANKR